MGTEEIKLIIDMLNGLGGATINSFIGYLAFKLLCTLLHYGCVIGVVYLIGHFVKLVVGRLSFSTQIESLFCADFDYTSDQNRVFKQIAVLKAKAEEK